MGPQTNPMPEKPLPERLMPDRSHSNPTVLFPFVGVRRIGGMADAEHSKCFARKGVWVQVPHPAQLAVDRGGSAVSETAAAHVRGRRRLRALHGGARYREVS